MLFTRSAGIVLTGMLLAASSGIVLMGQAGGASQEKNERILKKEAIPYSKAGSDRPDVEGLLRSLSRNVRRWRWASG
jgi:hypothetical protein